MTLIRRKHRTDPLAPAAGFSQTKDAVTVMDEQFVKLIDELRQLHAAVPTTGRVPWTRTVPGEAFASAAFAAMPELPRTITRLQDTIKGYQAECYAVEQTLGKALGYPAFADDTKNFPDATEAYGVCVGDHTAGTLAAEAAERIAKLTHERDAAREFVNAANKLVDVTRQQIAWAEEKQKVALESRDNQARNTAAFARENAALRSQLARLEESDERVAKLTRERDEAREELSTWHSVFPDIAPAATCSAR